MTIVAAVTLRPATIADAELIFRWRNDPAIVRVGSLQREVGWSEHMTWFAESISSQERQIFVIERDGAAIGQVRLDRMREPECVISIYLAGEFTGRSWGISAINEACEIAFQRWTIDSVLACVRADNHAGQSAFRKAGFREAKAGCGPEHKSFRLVRAK